MIFPFRIAATDHADYNRSVFNNFNFSHSIASSDRSVVIIITIIVVDAVWAQQASHRQFVMLRSEIKVSEKKANLHFSRVFAVRCSSSSRIWDQQQQQQQKSNEVIDLMMIYV